MGTTQMIFFSYEGVRFTITCAYQQFKKNNFHQLLFSKIIRLLIILHLVSRVPIDDMLSSRFNEKEKRSASG